MANETPDSEARAIRLRIEQAPQIIRTEVGVAQNAGERATTISEMTSRTASSNVSTVSERLADPSRVPPDPYGSRIHPRPASFAPAERRRGGVATVVIDIAGSCLQQEVSA